MERKDHAFEYSGDCLRVEGMVYIALSKGGD